MAGKLVVRGAPSHQCKPHLFADEEASGVGAIWQCDCGRRWVVVRYRMPSGMLSWEPQRLWRRGNRGEA